MNSCLKLCGLQTQWSAKVHGARSMIFVTSESISINWWSDCKTTRCLESFQEVEKQTLCFAGRVRESWTVINLEMTRSLKRTPSILDQVVKRFTTAPNIDNQRKVICNLYGLSRKEWPMWKKLHVSFARVDHQVVKGQERPVLLSSIKVISLEYRSRVNRVKSLRSLFYGVGPTRIIN